MKKIFITLLLLNSLVYAQDHQQAATDSLGKEITLPQLRRGEMPNFFEVGKQSTYLFPVKDSALYYEIFSRFPKESLPVIDFTKDDLILQASCAQCVASCNHKGTENEPCHRNNCSFTYKWFVRKKA